MFDLDPLLLARIQFAFTISFHIIFPAFSIGLASFLAVVEWRWLKTGKTVYRDIYKFWIKIFAVAFGMGVVSGVVLSYEIGTNWSAFSDRVGNVIGPLLAYEVLTAFFLESSFLGIMLFGWNRVSPRMHFASTVIVAVGTLTSAFWILAANSWMQTPQGYLTAPDGRLMPADWLQIIFNPSFPFRLAHMVTAAYLCTAFVVGGVGSWYLFGKRHIEHARVMVGMAMLMAVFVAPLQLLIGDAHGLNTLKYQPAKVAAMEGQWDREGHAALRLIALPDEAGEKTVDYLTVPGLASLILTHTRDGDIPGLKEFPKQDRPPVAVVFWSFRVMVGMGLAMIFTGLMAVILYVRKRLFDCRAFQMWCVAMTPAGFIALIAGWFVTEVGRQPWTVYGVLRTSESASPVLGPYIALSLAGFIVTYAIIFGFGLYYILKLIRKGLGNPEMPFGSHGVHSDKVIPT
jgi:cytochrome d ubiquinol oxidase subunit I